jgi:aminopeptidase N
MEYPTLFTGGSRWLSPEGSGSPEGVTVHECGHQFWFGLVANNEFEHAWLDEGFDTYSTGRVMEREFSPRYLVHRYLDDIIPVLFHDLQQSPRSVAGLGGYYSELKLDIMSKPSWQSGPAALRRSIDPGSRVSNGGAYGVNSYTKPAMMLQTLERYLGWETFQQIMATYFKRYKFEHPGPEDYFNTVEEVSRQDL